LIVVRDKSDYDLEDSLEDERVVIMLRSLERLMKLNLVSILNK